MGRKYWIDFLQAIRIYLKNVISSNANRGMPTIRNYFVTEEKDFTLLKISILIIFSFCRDLRHKFGYNCQ